MGWRPVDIPRLTRVARDDDSVEVVVGRIGKPHGLRGEVTVEVRTDEPERRFVAGTTLAAEPPRGSASGLTSLAIDSLRWHGTTLLVKFAELPDRTAAEGARGTLLLAHLDASESPADPDEFYDHQLVGLRVEDLDGAVIGEVTGLVHGAQDLLEIRATDGRPTLVPFVAALVPEVDLAAGRVVVADRPGLVAPFADGDA
jgi:16S rRNA processing protein RimM